MTPIRARLTLFAIMALFLATAGNALFLQERPGLHGTNSLPSTAVSITQFPPAATPRAVESPKLTGAPGTEGQDRLQAALQRALAEHGYADQLRAPNEGLRLAVLAYEFDNAMPLTGEPNRALLIQILSDLNQAPRGFFADRAEANPRLVMAVQEKLLGLGFFSGVLSGRMDVWTAAAVKTFQKHRGLEAAAG